MSHSTATVLVFTPTWIDPATGEDAIHPDVSAAIHAQTGVDFDWHVTSENPYPIPTDDRSAELRRESHRNVLHQYQRARAWFLNLPQYDVFISIEHDNLLPDNEALGRLLDTPGDVVYAPYLLRHGSRLLSTWQYINDRNLGMSLSNYRHELRQAREKKIHRVSGTGFGCTLIRRHVLEAIEFTAETDRDQNPCPDLRFAEDCLRKRFVSNGRFDVPVLHYDQGVWLHPYQNRRNGVKMYMPLENMNAVAAGRFVRLIQNTPISLTDEEANDLIRIGAVQLLPGQDDAAVRPEVSPARSVAEVETVAPRRNRRQTLKAD